MPHYVNVASGSFFWRGFLLRVCWLAVAAHRNGTQWREDGLRLQCALAAKTMTKKLTATPDTALSFGGVSRAVALACQDSVFDKRPTRYT